MPRGGGGRSGGGFGRSSGSGFGRSPFGQRAAPPRSTATASQPPKQQYSVPQGQLGGGSSGLLGTMGSSLAWGVGLGAGSEIGHQAVRGLMGSGNSQPQQYQQYPAQQQQSQVQQKYDPCTTYNTQFMECLQKSQEDISLCQNYVDLFKSCRKENPM